MTKRFTSPSAFSPASVLTIALAMAFCSFASAQTEEPSEEPPAEPPMEVESNLENENEEPEEIPLVEWKPLSDEECLAKLVAWADDSAGEQADRVSQRFESYLSNASSPLSRTQAFLTAASVASDELRAVLVRLDGSLDLGRVQQIAIEQSSSTFAAPVSDNLRLWTAIRFAQQGFYDEALEVIETVAMDQTVEPEAYLFYRALCQHQLVQLPEARASLESLLAPDYPLPTRFEQLALLMQRDLESVKPESLGAIARQMSDVSRRLGLGAADKQVQMVEDDIVDQIDKMIKKLEMQLQQQQQQMAGGPPSSPMDDSRLMPASGPGDVDIREIGDSAGWGELPPKERERIMQQIGREFPSYYRDVIEEYFRRLATEQPKEQP